MKLALTDYKTFIFKYYDQVDIYSYYLDIPPEEIIKCVKYKNYISNPLRVDYNPSLTFMLKGDKIKMIDSARREYNGDVFDIVGRIIEENSNDKQGFIKICNDIINNILPLDTISSDIVSVSKPITINKKGINKSNNSKEFETIINTWEKSNVRYWKEHHVDIKFLEQERVFPIRQGFINNYLYYNHSNNSPGFVYLLYKTSKGKDIIKWYFPYETKKRKFKTNNKLQFENIVDFKPNKYLFLIKSTKDRVVIKKLLSLSKSKIVRNLIKNTTFISLSSESFNFKKQIIEGLNKNYDRISVYLDNDKVGHSVENKYNSYFKFNFIESDNKDIADHVKVNGLKDNILFIENFFVTCLE